MDKYTYHIDDTFNLYRIIDGIEDLLDYRGITYRKNEEIDHTTIQLIAKRAIFSYTVLIELRVCNDELILTVKRGLRNKLDILLFGNDFEDTINEIRQYIQEIVNKEVIIDMNMRRRVIAATPIISLIIFLCMGYIFHMWAYGALAFLLIPIVPLALGEINLDAIYPLIVLAIYVGLGLGFGWWHPGWIVFLTIPVYYILCPSGRRWMRKQ
jgi:hypothetical protein